MTVRRDCNCARARHQHGTEQAYIADRCRCPNCRRAHADRAMWRRRMYAYGHDIAHLVPADGARRRLEALALLGWSCEALGRILDWDPVTLHRVRQQQRIVSRKHDAIADLHARLWNTPAPRGSKGERISANRTHALAVRRGYVPTLAWDDIDNDPYPPVVAIVGSHLDDYDEIKVERAVKGERLRLSRAERVEAVRRLHSWGLNDVEIGRRLHRTCDAVMKDRERYLPHTINRSAA